MRYHVLVVAAVLCLPLPAAASEAPKAELFGGYSYTRSDGENLHGWNASLAVNLSGWFGIVGDVSGHYGSVEGTDVSKLSFLIGPRLSHRREGLTLFAHALVGGLRTRAGITVLGVSISESETDAGGAVGGGADIKLAERWALRVQGDFVLVRADGETDGDPRASVGVTYRMGAKSR